MLKNIRVSLVLLLICGVIYPLLMTGIAQALMPAQADGSLITDATGKVVGSKLIGQTFTDPKYFSGRVSSIEYNAASSGSNNYAPSNPELVERTKKDVTALLATNPTIEQAAIPADLVTNSASGLDPHITPEAARVQVPRIAALRNLTTDQLNQLISKYTEDRSLGLFGEKRVNVLELNMALDQVK
ncbi:potassium-transporting ATPase subunit KdpC [Brevibacillus laterosporus]|uniref:potassium-transporting ATPase subunit KdpC n=1 Tax=Brevibacillus laterosporus TaxID=1465 RepID=UPI00215C6743|nr:potassium-transporting ATPase subunit KdpC [Brevibacillus laterosporus]MCR8938424.1 potassium-transporting ATPase subunit KdpC [Brevibacillus laterosporus]MCZ0841064.1 potassium-transporting ATPase subunit KdpC [Brevibacillus laterosporus]MCZ0844908.1 potassium-transporting ATPase subunit KdpC [Brevibacillus laterosporus]